MARSSITARLGLLLLLVPALVTAQIGDDSPFVPPDRPLDDSERASLTALFSQLAEHFNRHHTGGLHRLFSPLLPKEERKAAEQAIKTELDEIEYLNFRVLELNTPTRNEAGHVVEVRVEYEYEFRGRRGPGEARFTREQNSHFFEVDVSTPGGPFIMRSDFFLTLGRMPPRGEFWSALLGMMFALPAVALWLWALGDCFRRRPRQRGWRVLVLLLPIVSGVAYLLVVRLRKGPARPRPPAARTV